MPEGFEPRFHHRCLPGRQAAGKFLQIARRDHLAAGLLREFFQQRHVGRERTKFLRRQIRAPTGLSPTNFSTRHIRHDRPSPIATRRTGHKRRLKESRLRSRRLGLKPDRGRRRASVCAKGDRLDLDRDARLIQRLVTRIPRPHLQLDRAVGISRKGLDRQLHAPRHIGDQPAHELTPGLVHIRPRGRVLHAPTPHIAHHQRRTSPPAKSLHRERRQLPALLVAHRRDHARARLDSSHPVQNLKSRHLRQPHFFIGFIVPQPRPRLQPAFTRQLQFHRRLGRLLRRFLQIHRQQIANRRPSVIALLKRLHPAEHQETAAPFPDKFLHELRLFRREILALHIVQNQRVVAKQLLCRPRESRPQFHFILGVQTHQHRLVVALHFLRRLIPKPAEQWIARLARAPAEIKFRFPFRHADQPDQLHLVVRLHRPVQILELPIRPAGHVENPIRSCPSIDRDHAPIIERRRFGRCRHGAGFRRHLHFVKRQSFLLRLQLKAKRQRITVLLRRERLFLHQFPRLIGQGRHHVFTPKARRRDFRLDRNRGVLKRSLTHVHLLHRQIARRLAPTDHDRIDRRHARQVRQRHAAQVGGVTIREQKHSGQRPALEALFQRAQRARQRRSPTVKNQLMKIRRRL